MRASVGEWDGARWCSLAPGLEVQKEGHTKPIGTREHNHKPQPPPQSSNADAHFLSMHRDSNAQQLPDGHGFRGDGGHGGITTQSGNVVQPACLLRRPAPADYLAHRRIGDESSRKMLSESHSFYLGYAEKQKTGNRALRLRCGDGKTRRPDQVNCSD
ncbi:uncharacterized protein BKA78DRAFT_27743 [Phyllosticta capitalensis]|uniref:uncharacterized protein n=1 Tax=Phyllosticta capitalensis TaxID=121624 RepID=UPI003130BA98